MIANNKPLGVCSWSLKAPDVDSCIADIRGLEINRIQLALGPLLELPHESRQRAISTIQQSEIELTAGMISFRGENYASIDSIRESAGLSPNDSYCARHERLLAAGQLAQQLKINAISFHLGFIPKRDSREYDILIKRSADAAVAYRELGLSILLETGQETASELVEFLHRLGMPNVWVNFDPGNVILYGAGDPVESFRVLQTFVRHLHLKDAISSSRPGIDWGREVVFGTGDLNHIALLAAVNESRYSGPYILEFELELSHSASIVGVRSGLHNLQALLTQQKMPWS